MFTAGELTRHIKTLIHCFETTHCYVGNFINAFECECGVVQTIGHLVPYRLLVKRKDLGKYKFQV